MKKAAVSLSILYLFASASFGQSSHKPAENDSQPANKSRAIPAESLYQMMAAEFALNRTKPEIALANYIAAAKQTQDANVAKRATEIALSTSSLDIAIQPAELWAKLDPNNLEAQITVAAIHVRLINANKAIPYLERLTQIKPDIAHQHFLLLYQQLPEQKEQIELMKALEIISERSEHPAAILALGEILLSQGNPTKALTYSQKAIQQKPDMIDAIQLHANILVGLDKVAQAKSYLKQQTQKHPNLALQSFYLEFLAKNQFHEEGKALLAQLVKNNQLNPSQILQLAKFSMQAQWFDASKNLFLKLKATPESQDIAHYFLARLSEIHRDQVAAVEWYQQVLTGPFHVLSQIRASILLSDDKNYKKALDVLSRAKSQNKEDKKRIILTEVEILKKAKMKDKAIQRLNDAVSLAPYDLEIRYSRSLLATELNQFELAENDLLQILESNPNHVDTLNALGFLLTNHTKRYQEAHEYLTKALKLSPNNPSVLDSMGWLKFKMGQLEESLAILKKAASILPDPEIAAHLGEVLWHMKNYKEAREIWDQALNLSPNNEYILNAMNRLID